MKTLDTDKTAQSNILGEPHPARWWHQHDDHVICDLCPRCCSLNEGAPGFCFVRRNVAGQMVLVTYGHSTGFCVDPVEKKTTESFLSRNCVAIVRNRRV